MANIFAPASPEISSREKRNEERVRRIAAEGMVLLENRGVLPIKADGRPLAVFGSVFIGIIILIFANHRDMTNPFIVVLTCDGHDSEEKALKYLMKHTRRCTVKSKTAQRGSVELNLEVRLKDTDTDFVNTLSEMAGVQSVVLVSYNGDYMG